jgi:hypothetical protein
MKLLHKAQDEILKMLSTAKSIELQYMIRAEVPFFTDFLKHSTHQLSDVKRNGKVVKKLDYIALREEQYKSTLKTKLATEAAKQVKDAFLTQKELQDKALKEVMIFS